MEKNNSKLFTAVLIIFIAVIVLLIIILFYIKPNYIKTSSNEFLVTEVIDGDTFVIETLEYVRLIGVNAPEKNELFYNESKDFLSLLILNKTIILEKDLDNRDNFGRLLRYAYINNISINIELARKGYALPLFISPNFKHKQEIENATKECLKTKINLCASQ